MPPDVLFSRKDDADLVAQTALREGRSLYASSQCYRCHNLPEGVYLEKVAMPEIHALAPGFEAVDAEAIDEDIWHFLEWLVPRAGAEWTLDALKATGKVYKIPWA